MKIEKYNIRKSANGGYWVTTMNQSEAVDSDVCIFLISILYGAIFFSIVGIIALVKWAYKQIKAV